MGRFRACPNVYLPTFSVPAWLPARGVARVVMLLRLSLSTACTSLMLGDPPLRTGARVHLITTQANVKPGTHATATN